MTLKKWITKAELKEIINTYSVRKEEFKEVSEYSYVSNLAKGYMITVSEEFIGNDRTGRIIVAHTQGNGKKSFNDIWERDKTNKLYFKFRNPINCPLADSYYIKDLEKENEELRNAGNKLKKNADIAELQKLIIEKDAEIERLKGKNPRNAGRKVADEKWVESFNTFVRLYESQKSITEIMDEMKISRSTYFRYKKLYNDTNTQI